MYNLINGFIDFMQSPQNGFDFLGTVLSGNNTQEGPFLGVAPEGTEPPFMVFDIAGMPLWQGFGGVGSVYADQPQLMLHLYDTKPKRLVKNTEKLLAVMDVADASDFDVSGIGMLPRTDNPVILHDPIYQNSTRMYHAVVQYGLHAINNRGVDNT